MADSAITYVLYASRSVIRRSRHAARAGSALNSFARSPPDAAASLAYFERCRPTNKHRRHLTAKARSTNVRGQLQLFELLMRRAANYCELESGTISAVNRPAGSVKCRHRAEHDRSEPEAPAGELKTPLSLAERRSHADRSMIRSARAVRIRKSRRLLDRSANTAPVLASRPEGAVLAVPVKRGRGRPRKSAAPIGAAMIERGADKDCESENRSRQS